MKKSDLIKDLAKFLNDLGISEQYEGENLDNADEIVDFFDRAKLLTPPEIPGVYNPLLTPATVSPSGSIDQGFHRAWETEDE